MKYLLTGSTGFVGRALAQELATQCHAVRLALRTAGGGRHGPDQVIVGPIDGQTRWSDCFSDIDVVIHLAGRAHVLHDRSADPLGEYRRVNVDGTLNFARHSAAAGVKRFVFVSTVKVNGEFTPPGQRFSEMDDPNPADSYGRSKQEAEQGLRDIAARTGMELVVIRAPLVYGPGVKANFAELLHLVQRGWPLPFGSVENQRSLIALDNLVDFIVTCTSHPRAANETFMVSDDHDLSTAELVRGLARAMGLTACLFPMPVWLLRHVAMLFGKAAPMQRLCGNLQVDISKARQLLDWKPPISVDEGLRRTLLGPHQS